MIICGLLLAVCLLCKITHHTRLTSMWMSKVKKGSRFESDSDDDSDEPRRQSTSGPNKPKTSMVAQRTVESSDDSGSEAAGKQTMYHRAIGDEEEHDEEDEEMRTEDDSDEDPPMQMLSSPPPPPPRSASRSFGTAHTTPQPPAKPSSFLQQLLHQAKDDTSKRRQSTTAHSEVDEALRRREVDALEQHVIATLEAVVWKPRYDAHVVELQTATQTLGNSVANPSNPDMVPENGASDQEDSEEYIEDPRYFIHHSLQAVGSEWEVLAGEPFFRPLEFVADAMAFEKERAATVLFRLNHLEEFLGLSGVFDGCEIIADQSGSTHAEDPHVTPAKDEARDDDEEAHLRLKNPLLRLQADGTLQPPSADEGAESQNGRTTQRKSLDTKSSAVVTPPPSDLPSDGGTESEVSIQKRPTLSTEELTARINGSHGSLGIRCEHLDIMDEASRGALCAEEDTNRVLAEVDFLLYRMCNDVVESVRRNWELSGLPAPVPVDMAKEHADITAEIQSLALAIDSVNAKAAELSTQLQLREASFRAAIAEKRKSEVVLSAAQLIDVRRQAELAEQHSAEIAASRSALIQQSLDAARAGYLSKIVSNDEEIRELRRRIDLLNSAQRPLLRHQQCFHKESRLPYSTVAEHVGYSAARETVSMQRSQPFASRDDVLSDMSPIARLATTGVRTPYRSDIFDDERR